MTKMRTMEDLTKKISSVESVDFELDFLGNIECVFSTRKDSRLILYKGRTIYDLVHPINHADFELCLGGLSAETESAPFQIKIKDEETKSSYFVEVIVSRAEQTYNVKMKKIEKQEINRYDSSLFISLKQDIVDKRELYIGSNAISKLSGVSYEDISELLLPVLLDVSSKENYIVAKKFPHVLVESKIGESIFKDLFKWFFGKLDWFTGRKQFLIMAEVKESHLVISLKFTEGSLMVQDAIKERLEVSQAYERLLKNVQELKGSLMNIVSNQDHIRLSFPVKYNL